MSLLVTGSIGIDTVETPSGTRDQVLGGSALYFAYAASFFTPVRLVGVVGEDCPNALFHVFDGRDVDTRGLEVRKGSRTFRWHGSYLKDLNAAQTVEVDLNVLAERAPKIPPAFLDSQCVFLANTHPGLQMQMLQSLPEVRFSVADTMNLWIETERPALLALLRKIDGLVLNDGEARLLTGEPNLVAAAKKVLAMGPKFVIVKKGEHGSLMVSGKEIFALPAYPTDQVIDPTGAGDSFAGGLMGYLAARRDFSPPSIHRAMSFGSVVASFTISDFSFGGLAGISKADVEHRWNQYKVAVSI